MSREYRKKLPPTPPPASLQEELDRSPLDLGAAGAAGAAGTVGTSSLSASFRSDSSGSDSSGSAPLRGGSPITFIGSLPKDHTPKESEADADARPTSTSPRK
jgi:hypothetical protein